MDEVFLKIFNMSITAVWIILAVMVCRFVLTKAPKSIRKALWALVAFRLACPFSAQFKFSYIPSAELISKEQLYSASPTLNSGISVIDNAVNTIVSSSLAPTEIASINPLQVIVFIGSNIWLLGLVIMLVYGIASYVRINAKVRASIKLADNIRICDTVVSPFILGILKPKIYLPSQITQRQMQYVIMHEEMHIRKKDHILKLIGFVLLCVHWFNPFVWLAYTLFCRDIELVCDEHIVKNMTVEDIRAYSNILLDFSIPTHSSAAYPLAFSEVNIKSRIRSALKPREYRFWKVVLIGVVMLELVLGFMTDPVQAQHITEIPSGIAASTYEKINLKIEDQILDKSSPYLNIVWNNDTQNEIVFTERFYIYHYTEEGLVDQRTTKDYKWTDVAYIADFGMQTEHSYYIGDIDLSQDGYYVFSTEYSEENTTNDIIVQFMIETAENGERCIYQMSFDME